MAGPYRDALDTAVQRCAELQGQLIALEVALHRAPTAMRLVSTVEEALAEERRLARRVAELALEHRRAVQRAQEDAADLGVAGVVLAGEGLSSAASPSRRPTAREAALALGACLATLTVVCTLATLADEVLEPSPAPAAMVVGRSAAHGPMHVRLTGQVADDDHEPDATSGRCTIDVDVADGANVVSPCTIDVRCPRASRHFPSARCELGEPYFSAFCPGVDVDGADRGAFFETDGSAPRAVTILLDAR